MTFTVACPSCGMSFPVDPAKVPKGGVRAQCSMCPGIFDVDVPDENAAVVESSIEVADPVDAGAVDLPELEEPSGFADEPGDAASADFGAVDLDIELPEPEADEPTAEFEPPEQVAEPEAAATEPVVEEPAPDPVTEQPAEPASEAPPQGSGPIRFGRRSPEDKAKSLARSLVSDLIAYNPEKHKEALAAGTLQEVFGDEIEKSLKEFQEQVEPDVMAQGTIFNDALNSILAEGQSIFSLDN